jgi:hypothetical protein
MVAIVIIIAALTLILAIMRWSPIREKMERLDRSRAKRDAQTVVEVRQHPLTFVLTLLFASVCALGLIYIFAFSDTAADRLQHFYVVFALVAFVGTCLAFAKKREDRGPLPIRVRRIVWGVVLFSYAAALLLVLGLGLSPFSRFTDTLRLFCYLGSMAPLAFVAWSLFQSKGEANNSPEATPGQRPPEKPSPSSGAPQL